MWLCRLCCVQLVWSLPVLCRYACSNPWLSCGGVVVCMMSKSMLCSNGCCSVTSRSLRWYSWIYMASQLFMCLPFVHVLTNCMVSSWGAYSCLLFNICKAYTDWGLLVLIYLMFSLYLILIVLPVCPIYARLHVLHVSFYMPLDFPLVCFSDASKLNMLLVVLYALFIVLFLNTFVMLLINPP